MRTLCREEVLQAALVLKAELLLAPETGVEVGKALAAAMGLREERLEVKRLVEVEGEAVANTLLLVVGESKRLLADILLRVGVLILCRLGNCEVLLSPVEACGVTGVLSKAKLLRRGIRLIDSLLGVVVLEVAVFVLVFLCGVVGAFCFLALVRRALFIKD